MDHIELTEESDLFLGREVLAEDQALAIYRDPHFELEWPNPGNGRRYRVRSKGWVGHIPVGNTLLVVKPKAPVSSIFGMLELAYQLESFKLLEGEASIEHLPEIFERIVSVLARRVADRVRKGLFRSYLARQDDLEFVRGRIDIRGNVRNVITGLPRLRCHFEELTADVDDNQILLWALFLASRFGFGRQEIKLKVRRAYGSMVGAVSLTPRSALECLGRSYHRLNGDYRSLHGLCRFVIEHAGPGKEIGGHTFLPFSLFMPALFESYVAEWLRKYLPLELIVAPQYHLQLDANADLSFKIDLIIRSRRAGTPHCVLDTKYKMDEVPKEADIQQVVAYAHGLGVRSAFLIYPTILTKQVRARVGSVTVATVGFDLSGDVAAAGKYLLSAIQLALEAE